jgi:putative DNA primase/helicase
VTIDLRSVVVRDSRPEDYITKSTAVAPAPAGTRHPQWSAFLDRVTDGCQELQDYLQRMAGYCLTGDVREHAIFFLYGLGANGKSVFVNTLIGVWGDYALTIGTDMLMVSNTDRHPTEIARLRGVRLAVGSEIEVGKTWAEAKLKALSGGDPLQGRFMRQDFFEFLPQFKLMLVGNHKPSLRGVDEAMRRRLHLIPFTVTIPEGERDQELPEKLRTEWPAILRWAMDGFLEWQRKGLNPPTVVTDATRAYLDSEDALTLWMEDCTKPDANAWEPTGTLFASWKRWAERAGEFVGSQKRFSGLLEERGLQRHRQSGTGIRGYHGLRVDPVEQPGRWEP